MAEFNKEKALIEQVDGLRKAVMTATRAENRAQEKHAEAEAEVNDYALLKTVARTAYEIKANELRMHREQMERESKQ